MPDLIDIVQDLDAKIVLMLIALFLDYLHNFDMKYKCIATYILIQLDIILVKPVQNLRTEPFTYSSCTPLYSIFCFLL